MSKIYNVRRAFYKIFENLKNHEVSFLFFNNDFKIYTTIKDSPYSVDHSIMLNTIQNIRCSSITDFSQIMRGLRIIEGMNCNLPVISTIISDGYHTIDDDSHISFEEVKEELKEKFDVAIGLGTDYDRILLEHLSKKFHNDQSNNMFNFLNEYLSNNTNFIVMEPDTFMVSQKEFQIVENEILDNNVNDNIISVSKGKVQETFQFIPKDNNDHVIDTKHFLFIIDNSGSMDDTFHSRVLENFYEDADFYMVNTTHERKKIIFYDRNTNIIIGKKKDIIKEKNKNDDYNENDEIFRVCYEMSQIKEGNKLEIMYKLYNTDIVNTNLKKFIQRNYNLKLSSSEKKFNVLLHNEFDDKMKHGKTSSIGEKEQYHCSICFENIPTILFSCHHLFCCFQCVLKMLEEYYKPKCPICRQEIKWLRKCSFLEDNFLCTKCKVNVVNIYQSPCSHILYCSKCYPSRSRSCSECEEEIQDIRSINIV